MGQGGWGLATTGLLLVSLLWALAECVFSLATNRARVFVGNQQSACFHGQSARLVADAEQEQQFLLEMDSTQLRLERERNLLSEAQRYLSAQSALQASSRRVGDRCWHIVSRREERERTSEDMPRFDMHFLGIGNRRSIFPLS